MGLDDLLASIGGQESEPASYQPLVAQQPTESRSWIDRTFGTFVNSWVHNSKQVVRRVQHLDPTGYIFSEPLSQSDLVNGVISSLESFEAEHPDWAPQQVNSVRELVTDPGRLASLASEVLAYSTQVGAARVAGRALGGVFGPPGQAIGKVGGGYFWTYAVEGQEAYDSAKRFGASDSEAEVAANLTGAISGLLELAQYKSAIRFGGALRRHLSQKALQESYNILGRAGFGSLSRELLGEVAWQGLQEALQGTTHESVANRVYGAPIDWGNFLSRRAIEATAGAIGGTLFGGGHALLASSLGGEQQIQNVLRGEGAEFPVYKVDQFRKMLYDDFKLPANQAEEIFKLTEASDAVYSAQTGKPRGSWYEDYLAFQIDNPPVGEVLTQTPETVYDFFSHMENVIYDIPSEKLTGAQVLAELKKAGVKEEELRWTGMRGFLEDNKEKSLSLEQLRKMASSTRLQVESTVLREKLSDEDRDRLLDLYNKRQQLTEERRNLRLTMDDVAGLEPQRVPEITDLRIKNDNEYNEVLSQIEAIENSRALYSPRQGHPSQIVPGPYSNYQEILLNIPQATRVESDPVSNPHFPSYPNLLVHIRKTDREGPNGEKVLFVEEIQSDWAQMGNRAGFEGGEEEIKQASITIPSTDERSAQEVFDDMIGETIKGQPAITENSSLQDYKLKIKNDSKTFTFDFTEDPSEFRPFNVPRHPMPRSWQDLAIKKVFQLAAEGGYDGVAFVNDPQIKERNQTQEETQYLKVIPNKVRDVLKKIDESSEPGRVKLFSLTNIDAGPIVDSFLQRSFETLYNQIVLDSQNETDVELQRYFRSARNTLVRTGDIRQAIAKLPEDFQDEIFNEVDRALSAANSGDQLYVPITPTIRDAVREGLPLFQGPKGSVTFLSDGKAVIRAFENADISTVLHELAHIYRRQIANVAPDDLKILEDFYKVQDGNWTVEAEEKVARGFERYIREGHAPSQGLVRVFENLKTWMRKIYQVIRGSDIDVPLSTEVRGVFDRLFARDTEEIAAKRQEVSDLEAARREEADPGKQSVLRERIKVAKDELKLLQETNEIPTFSESDPRLVERVTTRNLGAEPEPVRGLRRWLINAHRFEVAISQAAPLRHFKTGQFLLDKLSTMEAYTRTLTGQFENQVADRYGQLSRSDHAWLRRVEGKHGLSNWRRMIDRQGMPSELQIADEDVPSGALLDYRNLMWEINDVLGKEAEDAGVLRRRGKGIVEPFRRAKNPTLARVPLDYTWKLFADRSGPEYEALVDGIIALNPELKRFPRKRARKIITTSLEGWLGERTVREAGSLEDVRQIRYMPDHIFVDGKPIAIMHVDPYYAATRAIDLQARRIAMVRVFGQENIFTGKSKLVRNLAAKLAKTLGVSPNAKESTIRHLIEVGHDEVTLRMQTDKTLRELAKLEQVAAGPTLLDIADALDKVSPFRLNATQEKAIRKVAARRGVTFEGPIDKVYNDLRLHLREDHADILEELGQRYANEGGRREDFDNVLRLWQGLPFKYLPRTPVYRALGLVSSAIGAAQTSFSVAPNLTQTLALVPKFVGWGKYLEAIDNVMSDPKMTRAQLAAMGAMQRNVYVWTTEPGYGVESLGRNIRQVAGKLTGLRWANERNQQISGEAFRLLAEDWKHHGLERADYTIARQLELTEKEIEEIRAGRMTDLIRNKIVQQGVAKSQFTTEARHNRGWLENVPLARMLVNYFSYTAGATRALTTEVDSLVSDMKQGNVEATTAGVKRLLSFVLGSSAAGLLGGELLRQLLKGQVSDLPEEDKADLALRGLIEMQFFGAAQRVLDPFNHDNDVVEVAMIGMMPHVAAVADFIGAAINYGRYQDFPLDKRVAEAALGNFPLGKSLRGWIDSQAYPAQFDYFEARRATKRFIDKEIEAGRRKKGKKIGITPLNPDYQPIYEAVYKDDRFEAQKLVQKFIIEKVVNSPDPQEELEGLRKSLLARAPVGVRLELYPRFFDSVEPKDRRAILEANHRYRTLVDFLIPSLGGSSGRSPFPVRLPGLPSV